jgi:leucyl aminopeptidase (aminopeptidase T)
MTEPSAEKLAHAANVLVCSALRVTTGERFVVVGDTSTASVMAALETAGRDAGAEVAALRLDLLRSQSTNHTGERPHKVLPDAIRRAMLSAQASVFIASAPRAESSMRDQLQHIASACKVRHAHLPGISAQAFVAGSSIDHGQLRADAARLMQILEVGREIHSTSPEGTNLVVHPGAQPWVRRVGDVAPGESVLFPTGSLVISPENVRGTFAATASLGEFFGARERLLLEPMLFEIESGCVRSVRSAGTPELVRDVEAMLSVAANSDRVGLVVLGINTGAPEPLGTAAVDQHRPGLHLVLGDPQTKLARISWSARTSFAACQTASSVTVDGVPVITDGRLNL